MQESYDVADLVGQGAALLTGRLRRGESSEDEEVEGVVAQGVGGRPQVPCGAEHRGRSQPGFGAFGRPQLAVEAEGPLGVHHRGKAGVAQLRGHVEGLGEGGVAVHQLPREGLDLAELGEQLDPSRAHAVAEGGKAAPEDVLRLGGRAGGEEIPAFVVGDLSDGLEVADRLELVSRPAPGGDRLLQTVEWAQRVSIFRLREGQICELILQYDTLGLSRQLGISLV